MSRTFDIVLFGATGYTGKLVAEYLLQARGSLRIAFAGRNADKLRALADSVGSAARDVECVQADADNTEDMARIAASTAVVATTVGPYALYGAKLVAACARAGTHYADLTGEVSFVRQSIDDNDAAAKSSGAKIVHCTGFDSIPSDLGVLLAATHAKTLGAGDLLKTSLVVLRAKGGFSGGTFASGMTLMAAAERDPKLRKLLVNPYSLTPDASTEIAVDGRDNRRVAQDRVSGQWTFPFIMAPVNTRIVRRSNALLGHLYGKQFAYDECMGAGTGASGFARAVTTAAALAAFNVAGSQESIRDLLKVYGPKPGDGPTEAERKNGHFHIGIFAKTTSGKTVRVDVRGDSDPGYSGTAKMIGEAAVALASGEALPAVGVLTPATALGLPFVERLRRAGFRYDASVLEA